MRDWLMENGERTSVMGGMAYDTDNDAWCELGSTEGSTPVWWRGKDRYSGKTARKPRRKTLEESLERRKAELVEARKIDALERELAEAKKKSTRKLGLHDDTGGLNWICVLGAIGFNITFYQAPAQYATAKLMVTVFLLAPVALSFVSLAIDKARKPWREVNRKRARELEAELKELKGKRRYRFQTVDEIADDIKRIENELAELTDQ